MSTKEYVVFTSYFANFPNGQILCIIRTSSHRKLALKRTDGEPLTRQDLQYDVLCGIFEDQHAIFTDPFSDARSGKVTFRDLYVNALINSPRSSKVLRDKMNDVPEFGTDFAKISLLANVGRINTTMACASSFISRHITICSHIMSVSVTMATDARQQMVRSLPRDAYYASNIPSGPGSAEDGRQSARCPTDQEHIEGMPTPE